MPIGHHAVRHATQLALAADARSGAGLGGVWRQVGEVAPSLSVVSLALHSASRAALVPAPRAAEARSLASPRRSSAQRWF